MNKKKFINFTLFLIFCFWHSLIISMPGIDVSGMPTIPQTPTPQQPISPTTQTPASISGTLSPTAPGAQGQILAPATTAPVSILPMQYATENDILNAITEAASPNTPLFNEIIGAKSKIEIYKVILKSLSTLFPNINLDTKRKIFDGFYTDVLNPMVDSSTYLVSDSALDDIYTKVLGDPSKTTVEPDKYPVFLLLKKVQDDMKKMTSPSISKYTQMFNKIYTSLLSGRTKLESQIKKQTNFSNDLDAAKAISLEKIANKIDAYQRLIINVNKSITLTNRKDLITDIGRLINLIGDDLAVRQKILNLFKFIQANKFFTESEKAQLIEFEKAKPTAGALATGAVAPTKQPDLTIAQQIPATQQTPSPTQPKISALAKAPAATPVTQDKKVVVNIDNLKKKLTAADKNYKELIKICYTVINLFPKITSPDNKKALVPILGDKLTFLYNKRSVLKKDELSALIIMFGKAQNIAELTAAINPQKINTLKLMSQLNIASAEKVLSKKIAAYLQISNSITKDVDSFEKGRFIDGITSLFSLRKQMTGVEIDAFKNLLNNLNSPTFKEKNIFDNTMQKTLADWIKIIECTSILFSQIESKTEKEQIALLKPILDKLTAPNAAYERKQLISVIIPQLFNSRGNLMRDDINAMKDLFISIQNKAGLLASNQISTIVAWIKELDDASKITTDKSIYISSLLDNAIKNKDLSTYEKILPLFTPQTPVTVMAAFVGALNNLFKARDSYDKKKALKLFQIINLMKLSNGTNLLGPAQKPIMIQWIKILDNETKPVQQPVAKA